LSTVAFDFNNLAFRCFFTKDVEISSPRPNFQIWKYLVFNSIYKSLFKQKTDEVILAVDDTNSWRKVYFPRYKESRKKNRDKQKDIDWKQLYGEMSAYTDEIKKLLPFKVIKVGRCEADDIIVVLTKEMVPEKKVTIISNDEDYTQLLYLPNVKIFNPYKADFVKRDDADMFVIEKCFIGQKKDDIFNVKTPSDWGLTEETKGKKKPGFGPSAFQKVVEYGWEKWLEENGLSENFKRNRILMDFNMIPSSISSKIIQKYKEYEMPSADGIYQFIKLNGFREYLENFSATESQLIRLF